MNFRIRLSELTAERYLSNVSHFCKHDRLFLTMAVDQKGLGGEQNYEFLKIFGASTSLNQKSCFLF